jgi:hypothetical protein
MGAIMTDELIEEYAEEFFKLPAILRKKNCYTFYAYVKSREIGYAFETIKNWLREE